MNDYRLYLLDNRAHIQDVVELYCEDHAAAIETARAHQDRRAKELWHREQRVCDFPPRATD